MIIPKGEITKIDCYREILHPMETYSSSEFFNAQLNHPDASIFTQNSSLEDFSGLTISIGMVLFFGVLHVPLTIGVVKGPEWMGKIVYVTAIFPLVMMFVLLIFSATLDGHLDGIHWYMKTNFCKVKEPRLWITALGQIFFSLSIGSGGLMTLASYNKFSNDILRDSLIVAFGNCVFSFVAGFGIFGFIGYMAKQVNADIEDVLRGIIYELS